MLSINGDTSALCPTNKCFHMYRNHSTSFRCRTAYTVTSTAAPLIIGDGNILRVVPRWYRSQRFQRLAVSVMCTYKTTLFSEFFNMCISGTSMRDKETMGNPGRPQFSSLHPWFQWWCHNLKVWSWPTLFHVGDTRSQARRDNLIKAHILLDD